MTTLATQATVVLVMGKDGNLYGATSAKIFSLTPTGKFKILASLPGVTALLQGADGNLYGATATRVFTVSLVGAFKSLAFTGAFGLIQGTDGFLYGGNSQKVFKLSTAGVLTTLFTCTNYGTGAYEDPSLDETISAFLPGPDGIAYFFLLGAAHPFDLDSGYSYAEIYTVGQNRVNSIFYEEDDDTFGDFYVTLEGQVAQDGFLYGTYIDSHGHQTGIITSSGTSLDPETIPAGNTPLISDAQRNLFGVNPTDGSFFEVRWEDEVFSKLGFFVLGGPGYTPQGRVLQAKDGNFYGTTTAGGNFGFGTVFKMTSAGALSAVASFSDKTTGTSPVGGLVQGADGNFYGVTTLGGTSNQGTIFRVTPTGAFNTLVNFDATNGALPKDPLVVGSEGNFYGTTPSGGASGLGTIFRMTPAGNLTTLLSFTGANGAQPNELLQVADGNFYGSTKTGGTNNLGTVFQLTLSGAFKTLVSFNDPGYGANPTGGLMQDSDGNLRGMDLLFGYSPRIFKITTSGNLGIVFDLGGYYAGATFPRQVLGADGNYYGTIPGEYGAIFETTPDGQLNYISFNTSTGRRPSGLIRARNNYLYGTAQSEGPSGGGTVFTLLPLKIQTIDFPPIPDHLSNDGYIDVPVSASSGLPVRLTVISGPAVADYQITPVRLTGNAGIVTIQATQSGDSSRSPAPPVTQSFTVRAVQTITFPVIPAQYVNVPPFAISATASSGLPVICSIVSGPATLSGNTVTLTGAPGTVVVKASQAGNASTIPASATQSFTVFLALQTIDFPDLGSPQPVGAVLTLKATASSGLPITYQVSGPGTLSGTKLTLNDIGKVTVTATQVGNGTYAARSATQNILVRKPQSISFPAVGSVSYGTTSTLAATASSGLVVTYNVVSGPATLSGKQLSFTGVGKVVIEASQAGNSTWLAAGSVKQTITVVKAAQTITFPGIGEQTWPVAPITLQATASSGLTITYSVSGHAEISGSVLKVTAPGTVNVSAREVGNSNYAAATPVTVSFKVAKAAQAITFPAIGDHRVGDVFTVTASANSGLPVAFSIQSGPATISGNQVTVTGKRTVRVKATQAGDVYYFAAPALLQSFTVTP